MLDQVTAANAVRAFITIAVFLLVVNYAFVPLLVDEFRQRVFKLRRELLRMRVKGFFSPEDRAYRLLMRRMNGAIRFAESLTFGHVLLSALTPMPTILKEESAAFDETLKVLDAPKRDMLASYNRALMTECARHLLITAPVLWLVILVTIPIAMLFQIKAILFRPVKMLARQTPVSRMLANASVRLPDDAAFA